MYVQTKTSHTFNNNIVKWKYGSQRNLFSFAKPRWKSTEILSCQKYTNKKIRVAKRKYSDKLKNGFQPKPCICLEACRKFQSPWDHHPLLRLTKIWLRTWTPTTAGLRRIRSHPSRDSPFNTFLPRHLQHQKHINISIRYTFLRIYNAETQREVSLEKKS